MLKRLYNKKGFTLIELIVVLAVLVVLSVIAVPRFLDVQKNAKIDADYSTGAMIAKAAELYLAKETEIPDSLTCADLVSKNYIEEIKFQSNSLKEYESADVEITSEDPGKVTVKVNKDDATFVQLYPKPDTLLTE